MKTYPKIVSYLTGITFLSSAVLCCCLYDTASANVSSKMAMSSECHQLVSAKAFQQAHKTQSDETCLCPQLTTKAIQSDFSKILYAGSSHQFFALDVLQDVVIATSHLLSSSHLLGPPVQYVSTTPLYLQNSVLRI